MLGARYVLHGCGVRIGIFTPPKISALAADTYFASMIPGVSGLLLSWPSIFAKLPTALITVGPAWITAVDAAAPALAEICHF
jgi:hypothetical protein